MKQNATWGHTLQGRISKWGNNGTLVVSKRSHLPSCRISSGTYSWHSDNKVNTTLPETLLLSLSAGNNLVKQEAAKAKSIFLFSPNPSSPTQSKLVGREHIYLPFLKPAHLPK